MLDSIGIIWVAGMRRSNRVDQLGTGIQRTLYAVVVGTQLPHIANDIIQTISIRGK